MLSLCVCLVLAGGCATCPKGKPVPVQDIPAWELHEASAFSAVQSVVFQLYGRKMTGLGVLALDRESRSFKLSCMSPMGTKLFDLQMQNGTPEVLFALPFFTEKEGFAEAVAMDIARVYFIPEEETRIGVFQARKGLVFEYRQGNENTQVLRHPQSGHMLEKKMMKECETEAEIMYRDYSASGRFTYAQTIQLKNRTYGYLLTLKTKEYTPRQSK